MIFSRRQRVLLESNSILLFVIVFELFIIFRLLRNDNRAEDTENDEELKKFMEIRRIALNSGDAIRNKILEMTNQNDSEKFYDSIQIEAICPKKVRVGGDGDSGKVTCDPQKVKNDCTMMSLGLNDQIEYDVEIQKITENRCKILGADMNPQKNKTYDKYYQMRGTLFVGQIPDTLKIYRLMAMSGSREVEILKIDIESGEHEGLEPFLKRFHVCQILIEIHGFPVKQLSMLRKISKQGFRLFSIETNPLCPVCCEYSFISEVCMKQYDVFPIGNFIPV